MPLVADSLVTVPSRRLFPSQVDLWWREVEEGRSRGGGEGEVEKLRDKERKVEEKRERKELGRVKRKKRWPANIFYVDLLISLSTKRKLFVCKNVFFFKWS